jgi:hypothetical protein
MKFELILILQTFEEGDGDGEVGDGEVGDGEKEDSTA